MYEILSEINEELARVNAGIVVWKITPKEGNGEEPAKRRRAGRTGRALAAERRGQCLAAHHQRARRPGGLDLDP